MNPLLPLIRRLGFGEYYWAIDACEVATDLMWKNRKGLLGLLDDLFDHALRVFSADDVVRFLGHKILPAKAELSSVHKRYFDKSEARAGRLRRPEARRIKHRIRQNWIKMYDKWSVLRIETVINYPRDFRVLRFRTDRRGRRRGRWMPMGKGIQNLWRYLEVGEAANRRYLEGLAPAIPTAQAIAELDTVCRGHWHNSRRIPRLNPICDTDSEIFQAVLSGEHAISGLRNRDLQGRLYASPASSLQEAKRRCARASRLIAKLRGHGLLAKVPGNRLYRVTAKGHRVMAAALRFRLKDFPAAKAA